ncbi:hypothetical protein A5641_12185 [Mycobacterium sp. 1554424.7]|nr:hypothetical protein A5641_12185 [Mycobacterium sp. 1554424.7]
MSNLSRAATREEILDAARRQFHRLRRHMDALQAGEVGAVDDVAGVLRALLAHGSGDDGLKRLCKMHGINLPKVYVSEPVADQQSIALAFGAVPAPADFEEPARYLDTDAWRRLPALIVRSAPRRVSTWEQVIREYGNTFGSHLSGTIPHLLSEISSICYSGPLDLGEYLIHCAGIVAEDALQQALSTIDGDADAATKCPQHQRLNPIVRLIVERQAPKGGISAQYSIAGYPIGSTIELVKVRLNDQNFILKVTRDTANASTFDWEYEQSGPGAWRGSGTEKHRV